MYLFFSVENPSNKLISDLADAIIEDEVEIDFIENFNPFLSDSDVKSDIIALMNEEMILRVKDKSVLKFELKTDSEDNDVLDLRNIEKVLDDNYISYIAINEGFASKRECRFIEPSAGLSYFDSNNESHEFFSAISNTGKESDSLLGYRATMSVTHTDTEKYHSTIIDRFLLGDDIEHLVKQKQDVELNF
jgi:hypothetical protein